MYIFVIIDSLASNSSTIKDDVNQSSSSSSPNPPTPPIQLPTSNNKDDIIMNEFVKPSKIHIQSLHREDLLYESQKINPGKIAYLYKRRISMQTYLILGFHSTNFNSS